MIYYKLLALHIRKFLVNFYDMMRSIKKFSDEELEIALHKQLRRFLKK